ncbi:MAG TPA: MarR family transcriptional regulator [Gemmatimonadaceae bacterium]|jgi:DNA-binding MarR family transcriptional regulator|nr:MarR family transcriptional regulator [Gemmatimonadaceae bacterium]
MPATLRTEIKQTKPFGSLEQEAQLNIERTAAVLGHAFAEALRPFGITPTQYNALRILRGAGKDGLCRNEVRERLISQVPDVTRLLDRLEEMKLIERQRSTEDRRLVTTRITSRGTTLLRELDGPIAEVHKRHLGHMSVRQLTTLNELLTLAREAI